MSLNNCLLDKIYLYQIWEIIRFLEFQLISNTIFQEPLTHQGWVSHQTQLCDSQVYRRISEVR